MRLLVAFLMVLIGQQALARQFELPEHQESYQVPVGETIRIPIKITNQSDKPQFYIIRKAHAELGSSQKGYFCLDKNCLEAGISEFSKRVEPGETITQLVFVLESGLVPGVQTVKFNIYPKGLPAESKELAIAINVHERTEKPVLFQSKDITIQDVYPNPVQDHAYIDYRIHNEHVKARLTIHNILGKPMQDFDLPAAENRLKLQTEDYTSGIYFYTLYVDNTGVLTRKLIIRK
ncbi:MAG: T9SS type A sorting domain-containing protein [Cyclobacteriaceae bacterium]|nr:T9SS type A sorting domain-containing protein [Cytophagales bacterium]MBX2899904.1 T9SS type A sorting domain-containing protein [Cyclobacteriaceae bacterium]